MTESQKRFLTSYLGEEWKGDIVDGICERCGTVFSVNRTFTTAQDKQDLLEKIDKKHEWKGFISHCVENEEFSYKWLILLSPLETAELICKWKWCV